MRFFDFFAGIGGFRLGMELAGHQCVGHCEIDKYADMSYRAMHKPKESEVFFNDIRTIKPSDMPECECYCIGHLGTGSERKVFPIRTYSEAVDGVQGHEGSRIIGNALKVGGSDTVGTYIATDRQTDIPQSERLPQVELVNAYKYGTCRTIKAQYNNTSYANLVRQDSFGASAVMVMKK